MISRDLRPNGRLRALFLIRKWLRTRRHSRTSDVSLVEASPVPLPGFVVSRRDCQVEMHSLGFRTVAPCVPCVVEALVSFPV